MKKCSLSHAPQGLFLWLLLALMEAPLQGQMRPALVVKQATQLGSHRQLLQANTITATNNAVPQMRTVIWPMASIEVETNAALGDPWVHYSFAHFQATCVLLPETNACGFERIVISWTNGLFFQQQLFTNSVNSSITTTN